MNTAINAYTSNYESCYSRDACLGRGGRERLAREKRRNGDGERKREQADAQHPGLDTANKRRMRVNRVKQTRAALGNNEVTRSNCRSDARARVYTRRLPPTLRENNSRDYPARPTTARCGRRSRALSRPLAFFREAKEVELEKYFTSDNSSLTSNRNIKIIRRYFFNGLKSL